METLVYPSIGNTRFREIISSDYYSWTHLHRQSAAFVLN